VAEEEYVGVVCCCAELEEVPTKTEDEDSVYDVGGGATGLVSSAQAQKRVETPIKPKDRIFFFMITKYSLQKRIDVAKTFLLSLESL
jgi:hypothetical protein